MTTDNKSFMLKDGSKLTISPAAIDDAGEIVTFLNTVGGESEYLTFSKNEFPYSIEEERSIILACQAERKGLMLVGRITNQIVSQLFIEISDQPRLSHIGYLGISVSKKYWGLKIGSYILGQAISMAKETNLTKLSLQVRVDNSSAVNLYTNYSFEIEGTIKRSLKIKETYFDEYIMGLNL